MDTSSQAYHERLDDGSDKRFKQRLLTYMRDNQTWGDEEHGWICDKLEQIMHAPHQTVSPSLKELRDAGLTYLTGYRGTTRYDKEAYEWRTVLRPHEPIPPIPSVKREAKTGKDNLVETPMTGHSAILGGSNAARLLACPASYHESLKTPYVDTPSAYAAEGTLLHNMMAGMLADKRALKDLEFDGNFVSDMVTSDQIAVLEKAKAALDVLKAKYGGHFSLVTIESMLRMPHVPGSFGSVDLIMTNGSTVIIVDWKFGAGIAVKAAYPTGDNDEEQVNPQLMFYAICARAAFRAKFKKKKIVLAIIQPRFPEPLDLVEVTDEELDEFHRAFQHAFVQALSRDAHRARGEHCRFALCKATCPLWTGPVIEMSVLDPKRAALEASLQPVEATEYGDYMSHALSMAELAETWAGEIRKQGHLYLEDGGYIPHWKLVPKRGLRKWASEDDAVADLMKIGAVQGDMFNLPELRSVAQVEKSLKAKGIALPEDLWMLVSSGTTIARSDDPRPESTHGMVIENMRKALKRL